MTKKELQSRINTLKTIALVFEQDKSTKMQETLKTIKLVINYFTIEDREEFFNQTFEMLKNNNHDYFLDTEKSDTTCD